MEVENKMDTFRIYIYIYYSASLYLGLLDINKFHFIF